MIAEIENSSSNITTTLIVTILLTYIIIGVICGILSQKLHDNKGYPGGFWIGFFLSIVGLIYSAGLPDLVSRRITLSSNQTTPASTYSAPNDPRTVAPNDAATNAPQQMQPPIPETIPTPVLIRDTKGQIVAFKINDTTFAVGDAVKHPTLGEGVITEISEKEFAVKLKKGLVVHPDIKGNKYEKI